MFQALHYAAQEPGTQRPAIPRQLQEGASLTDGALPALTADAERFVTDTEGWYANYSAMLAAEAHTKPAGVTPPTRPIHPTNVGSIGAPERVVLDLTQE